MTPKIREARLDYHGILVSPKDTLRVAMERMTVTNIAIVLAVDQQRKLQGVLVDGDIRRALLAHGDLSQPVESIMTRRPRTAPFDITDGTLHDLAQEALSTWLPLVDENGILRGLIDLALFRQSRGRLENAVVIMAGGRGERLMPHTAAIPKPMIPVGGRPILETLVRALHGNGFDRFYFSVNYLAEYIEDHFGDGEAIGVSITYLREEKPLGTAGSLRQLANVEKLPILVINGDVLTRFNPKAMLDLHLRERAQITMAVRDYSHQVPFGVVESVNGRFVTIREKPTYTMQISSGIYVVDPSVLDKIPPDTRFDMPDLLSAITELRADRVMCFPISDYWMDVGREEDLHRARADFEKNF
jgi:dTDP-glucose pyrophosphorylase/CBS domain-containing protein